MRTTIEPLEGNRVKLTVDVDSDEIGAASDETLRRLGREARMPGFRPGKVPRRLLEARLGPKAIREEVLRDALPRYYADAIEEAELDVIAPPEIDVKEGEEEGPVSFDAVVEVRPHVAIPGYEGLVVTLPKPDPSDEEVDAQVDRLREQFATLTEVERPARDHDLVTLDVHGTRDGEPAEGLSADDLVYEVGTGGIVEGIDEKLFNAKVGDIFELDAQDAPGGPAHLRVLVKQVRQKVLPDPTDEFAADASEFETLEELRSDLRERISRVRRMSANLALRERAVEALVELVAEDPPESLVRYETHQLLEDLSHRLSHEKVSLEDYLAMTGRNEETLLADFEQQAARQVKADLAMRALADAEDVVVDESDLDEEIVRLADQTGRTPAETRELLERNDRLAGLRSQLRLAKAMAWLIEHVAIVDDEGNPMDRAALTVETPDEAPGENEAAEALAETVK